MEAKRLMKVTYQDLKKGIRLNAYADAVIWSEVVSRFFRTLVCKLWHE